MSTTYDEAILEGHNLDDRVQSDILGILRGVYVFPDESRISLFLAQNTLLTPLLLQANSKIADYFGLSATTVLDLSSDPDDPKSEELWARVQTNLRPAEALRVLDRFDEEWWLDASESSRNLLNIKLEYV